MEMGEPVAAGWPQCSCRVVGSRPVPSGTNASPQPGTRQTVPDTPWPSGWVLSCYV